MSEMTAAQLVQKLLNDAAYVENAIGHEHIAREIGAHLRLAAHRLEAREISEADIRAETINDVLAAIRDFMPEEAISEAGNIVRETCLDLIEIVGELGQAEAREISEAMVERAWRAYDAKAGYSKPERIRAALEAAKEGETP